MEKHRCSLCSRRFSSGRALGGHMRSHVIAVAPTPKLQRRQCAAAASSSSAGCIVVAGAEEDVELTKENYRKRFRPVEPPELSSVIAEDGESESESESELPGAGAAAAQRDGSKRAREARSPTSPDPTSSTSVVTTEEDVARCLMMLSRDIWAVGKDPLVTARTRPPRRERSKYQCGKCKKVLRSNQALASHRASHEKLGGRNSAIRSPASGDVFECPFCFRVFASGQALGGHKRSHLAAPAATSITITSPESVPPPSSSSPSTSTAGAAAADKYDNGLASIDLNLPAAEEADENDMIGCFGQQSELRFRPSNQTVAQYMKKEI